MRKVERQLTSTVFKVWSPDQQQGHHRRTLEMQIIIYCPRPSDSATCILTGPPSDSEKFLSVRTIISGNLGVYGKKQPEMSTSAPTAERNSLEVALLLPFPLSLEFLHF